MGLEDRDWYRDLQRERAGLKPKWGNWRDKSKSNFSDPEPPPFREKTRINRPDEPPEAVFISRSGETEFEPNRAPDIHPILTFLGVAIFCIVVYGLARIFRIR